MKSQFAECTTRKLLVAGILYETASEFFPIFININIF